MAEFFKEHNIVRGDCSNAAKEVDERCESREKIAPIYGVYKQEDGYDYMRLTQGESNGLDRVANLTGLDRDTALELVLNRYLEKARH